MRSKITRRVQHLNQKLEAMVTENQKTILEENTSEVPSDHELFAGEVHKELSERQVFVGDEEFFKSLKDALQPAVTEKPTGASQITTVPIEPRRFSTIQKVLVASIVLIATIMLYGLLKSPPETKTSPAPILAEQQTPIPKPPVADSTKIIQKQIQEPEPAPPPMQPMSLKVAETFYLKRDYDKAYAAYEQLLQSLPSGAEEELMRDFLQLKMALCMENMSDFEQASRLFRVVSKSRSPIVRVVANYHRSLLRMQKEQYLNARTTTYQAIASIDAVDFDKNWALSMKHDCHFLLAEVMTRNVLSLCDADKNLPKDLWGILGTQKDPFINLNETQLRTLLSSGSERLNEALLGPQIQGLEQQGSSPRLTVVCSGAPIEELLARFAANTGLDVHWTLSSDRVGIRKRAVNLYLPKATTQQIVAAAAGYAGLLARLDEKGVVNIFNPAEYSSLSEHISLLSTEAISLWQKFLLEFHDDKRLANAHFALGLLKAQKGQTAESIAEYKLVANRFSRSSLAPFALLYSSNLKASLRDYPGVRQDLNQLVEQYPDTEIAGQAYLYLADTTMKAQLYEKAERLYRKVYNLSLSFESQITAALGAGRCFYEVKDYESAAKWLTRYIRLARDGKHKDLYSAYFLLGKTNLALEKYEDACDALRYALQGELSNEEYIGTVSALVGGYVNQGNFVQALNVLETVHLQQSSQEEYIEILLLNSRVLRAMGLVDKAIATLGNEAEYISDPQLKARIYSELADCYIAKGNLGYAREKLTEILVIVEPGPLAYETTLKLADICLKLGQESQAISVCSQLLDLDPPKQIEQKALGLLAAAYNQRQNYDRAALALLGQWK